MREEAELDDFSGIAVGASCQEQTILPRVEPGDERPSLSGKRNFSDKKDN